MMHTSTMRRSCRLAPFALAILVALPGGLHAQSGGVSLALGTQGPTADLEDLDGNAVSLLDYVEAGKPAVLEF